MAPSDSLVLSTFGAQFPTFCAYTEKKNVAMPDCNNK